MYTQLVTAGVLKNAAASSNDIVTITTGNVFVAQSPEVFGYDADGNLTNDGRWAYSWDAENRLTGMQKHLASNETATISIAFAYDYLGRRVSKTVTNGFTNNYIIAASGTSFAYDSWNLVGERDGIFGNPLHSYMWGLDLSGTPQGAGGIGGLLAEFNLQSSTSTNFVAYDGNGDVTALIDANSGAISAQYEYGSFGEPIRVTGPAAGVNPFRFSTEYEDGETGKYYWKNRFYDANTGRWLSRDPVAEQGFELLSREAAGILGDSGNLYGLSDNDPVDMFDGFGLFNYHWKGKITDAQKQAIESSITRVGDRVNTLVKQMDDNIKSLRKCPCPAYEDLAKKLEGLKKVLQGMASVISAPKYDLNVYVQSTPGASATYWLSPVSWYNDHLTLDPSWLSTGDQDTTMFHEISHSQGTDDETPNDYNNAHLIEGLMTVDKENWIIWKFDKKKADEKCKSGGK